MSVPPPTGTVPAPPFEALLEKFRLLNQNRIFGDNPLGLDAMEAVVSDLKEWLPAEWEFIKKHGG